MGRAARRRPGCRRRGARLHPRWGAGARARRRLRPARKPGKLPADTVSAEYLLEYGVDALHVHADALSGGARVLVHDDLLATGGTAGALVALARQMGAEVVGCAFLVELAFLHGRDRLEGLDVNALISYDEE